MSVKLVLFIVLGLVFVLDFILKGLKKPSEIKQKMVTSKESSKETKVSNRFNFSLRYFIERPRNTGLYLFLILILKLLINFFVYPKEYTDLEKFHLFSDWEAQIKGEATTPEAPFTYYIENLFSYYGDDEFSMLIMMWIVSIVLVSFIAWQLNPHVKKR